MKKTNKKGFTIVELVIVIAVIAILAAVLIPTFSNVVNNANASAAMQACSAAYTEALSEVYKDGTVTDNETATVNSFEFVFGKDAATCSCTYRGSSDKYKGYSYTYASGSWSATKSGN